MSKSKVIDKDTVKKLEETKKAVLKRVAENLKNQSKETNLQAGHSSHSSGSGRTHSSFVSA